jgi:DNA-binding transcriptional regulator YiaG
MTSNRVKTIKRLRRLAKTMTQAQAAERLNVHRQWVHVLAHDYGIRFRGQPKARPLRRCDTCAFKLCDAPRCLRCKWTPKRIKRLRERYGLSQINMSVHVLRMNVFACQRWETGRALPAPRSLRLLERSEKKIRRRTTA